MSVEAKNSVADGLGIFDLIAEYFVSSNSLLLEASPIYQTLDMEWEISGSYSDGTYNYDYSYTTSAPQRTRESIRTSIVSYTARAIGGYGESLSTDFAYAGDPATDKIHIGVIPALYDEYGKAFYSPLYQPIQFNGGLYEEIGAVVGTRTKISDSTVDDIGADITILTPTFFASSILGRTLVDTWSFAATGIFDSVDLTTYSDTDWRDLRGTYNFSATDSNGITTNATWVIG